jgi:hypothetical protein
MPRKTATALQAGDKVRRTDTGEIITLTYVGRGMSPDTLLIQWIDRHGNNWAYVHPDQELEVL